jgi:hypothetical protein
MDLTNEQREVLEAPIPDPVRRADGRGRPWRDSRDVLNGILWVPRVGDPEPQACTLPTPAEQERDNATAP